MIRAFLFLSASAGALSIAACSPAPCSSCRAVNQTYSETAQSKTVDCGDLRFLTFGGGSDAVTVTQIGSELTLEGSSGFSMPGVLHEDMSATFGPVPATAEPTSNSEVQEPEPGKAYLMGWFTFSGGRAVSFEGSYVFIANVDGCEIDASTQWTAVK